MLSFVVMVMAVFGLTLIVTKSKILACKREFVEKRYEASKVYWEDNPAPTIVRWAHAWWHAMWTCPMCLGVWVSAPLVLIWPVTGVWLLDWAAVFGFNWIVHKVEDFLILATEYLEAVLQGDENEPDTDAS